MTEALSFIICASYRENAGMSKMAVLRAGDPSGICTPSQDARLMPTARLSSGMTYIRVFAFR